MMTHNQTESSNPDSSQWTLTNRLQHGHKAQAPTRRKRVLWTMTILVPFVVLVALAARSAQQATVRAEREKAQRQAERAERLYQEARNSDACRSLDMLSSQLESSMRRY